MLNFMPPPPENSRRGKDNDDEEEAAADASEVCRPPNIIKMKELILMFFIQDSLNMSISDEYSSDVKLAVSRISEKEMSFELLDVRRFSLHLSTVEARSRP